MQDFDITVEYISSDYVDWTLDITPFVHIANSGNTVLVSYYATQ